MIKMSTGNKRQYKRGNSSSTINLVVLIIFFFLYNSCKNESHQKKFNDNTITTIAKATRIKNSGKTHQLRYYFYVNNERILGGITSSNESYINKFFSVRYDLNKPEKNHIALNRQLKPDSITLAKAGFTKIKYYIYI
jgi:hypothetical protein